METVIHPVFRTALAQGREGLNARFREARRSAPGIDPGEFLAHLAGPVNAVVAVAAEAGRPGLDALVEALFGVSLELFALGRLGGRNPSPVLKTVWASTLPALTSHLTAAPGRLAAAVVNAALHLAGESEAATERWLSALTGLAGLARGADDILAAGQVLAWSVAGMAHYRDSALDVWDRLPTTLRGAVLGLPGADEARLLAVGAGLRGSRWYNPRADGKPAALRVVGRVGGFRGFGGPFAEPPWVVAEACRLFACDSQGAWEIHADIFGRTLRPAGPARTRDPRVAAAGVVAENGLVRFQEQEARFPPFVGVSSRAASGETLALTLERSHYVWLVASSP